MLSISDKYPAIWFVLKIYRFIHKQTSIKLQNDGLEKKYSTHQK